MALRKFYVSSKANSPVRKLERLHDDLDRLSTCAVCLSELDGEQLAALGLGDHLDNLHRSLVRFEQVCMERSERLIEDDWAETDLRQDFQNKQASVQDANRLLGELSSALSRLRFNAGAARAIEQLTEDVSSLNQVITAALAEQMLDECDPA